MILKKKKGISLILLILAAVILLIPATGAVASALSGHYLIGLSGVIGGNPSIGMYGSSVHQGIGFDDWHININPASPAGNVQLQFAQATSGTYDTYILGYDSSMIATQLK